MKKKCEHEFRQTTDNHGATDGYFCIKCLYWVEIDDAKDYAEESRGEGK